VTRYARAVIRWRWLVLALNAVIAVAAIAGLRHLEFRADYRYFFGPDNPELEAFERIENTYTKTDNVLFVLVPESGDVFSRETLSAVHWLTEQGWQIPYSLRVDSITNFQRTRAEADDLIVEDLVEDPEALDSQGLAQIRKIALFEPTLAGKLVARDAGATGVNVTIQFPETEAIGPDATSLLPAISWPSSSTAIRSCAWPSRAPWPSTSRSARRPSTTSRRWSR